MERIVETGQKRGISRRGLIKGAVAGGLLIATRGGVIDVVSASAASPERLDPQSIVLFDHSGKGQGYALSDKGGVETSKTRPQLAPIVEQLPEGQNQIAITIDDFWWKDKAVEVLNILAQERVNCTIFPVGQAVKKNPDLARDAFDAGHEVGLHTQGHLYLTKLPPHKVVEQVDRNIYWVGDAMQSRPWQPKVFRLPYGDGDPNMGPPAGNKSKTQDIRRIAGRRDLVIVGWNIDPEGYRKGTTSEQVYEGFTDEVKDGSISLFHAGATDIGALRDVIIYARDYRGFNLVPVGQALGL